MKKTIIKLTEKIKLILLDLAYWIAQSGNTISAVNKYNSVLILPPADRWEGREQYSFGDEMLMLGLYDGLKDKFGDNIYAISMNGNENRAVVMHGHPIKIIGFKKGWISLSSYREFVKIINNHSHFIVMGADVMDGAYGIINSTQRLRFLKLAIKKGLKTAITGCSFNGTKNDEIRNLLIDAERSGSVIHAREKISHFRLKEFLKSPLLVADLAFKVDVTKYEEPNSIAKIKEQAEEWKKNNGPIIGLNLCGWHIKNKDQFFNKFLDALLAANESLGSMALVLIPHDTREEVGSDLATLEELRNRISEKIKIIGLPSDIHTGIDAKQAVACCDILLTGRMHLAIAAHDQGVPAVSFAYQGKFEGFYDLYKMKSEWIVTYEDPDLAVQKIADALRKKYELKAKIVSARKEVRVAADLNFKWL